MLIVDGNNFFHLFKLNNFQVNKNFHLTRFVIYLIFCFINIFI